MKICVIGLGYVGLPLAVGLAKHFSVVGFDIDEGRVGQLDNNIDVTNEVSSDELKAVRLNLNFTELVSELIGFDVYIVSVPTPIDNALNPDFSALKAASNTVAQVISKGAVIVFESTVYPGATREVMVPILEKVSGFVKDKDFFVGYSPERINPGDKEHRFENIVKVVGSDSQVGRDVLSLVYGTAVTAGIHLVDSLEVAEMAKVIENIQRDVNIALMNELAIVADKLDISIGSVLAAAETKWNFLPFKPGLVGGHCIGVDPYYLIHKAKEVGFNSDLILAARRTNEAAVGFYVSKIIKFLLALGVGTNPSVLLFGCTFKPDCPDMRNSKVKDCARELNDFGISVYAHDPYFEEIQVDFGPVMKDWVSQGMPSPDLAVLMVEHRVYLDIGKAGLQKMLGDGVPLFDIKNCLSD